MADCNYQQVAVVMVPFIAQGHLNQLLHLSRLISAYDIPIHFITTTTHSRQAKLRSSSIHGLDPTFHFHEIPTPSFSSPPPDPNATSKFPSHLQPSFDSTFNLRQPVAQLLREISSTAKKIVLIHDSLMTYVVQDVVTLHNAESYVFRALSAFFLFWLNWEKLGRPFNIDPEIQAHTPNLEECISPEFVEFLRIQASFQNFHSGILLDSSRVIEGRYIDLFDREEITGKPKVWALGPFNPVQVNNTLHRRHICLDWLDKQEAKSVIYVSFGTTTIMSKEEIHQLAIGLEESEEKFLWVLRDADRGDVLGEDLRVELPKGYEERVKEKGGIVVRDWAPQIEILGHPSTGGFMSHCGWNSCMESLTAGVPLATWPMHTDQPGNAVLITEVLKTGLVLKNWCDRKELISSSSIGNVVRRLMSSVEGEEIRERAKELSQSIKKSVAQGEGVELDSFIAHITHL